MYPLLKRVCCTLIAAEDAASDASPDTSNSKETHGLDGCLTPTFEAITFYLVLIHASKIGGFVVCGVRLCGLPVVLHAMRMC